MIHSFPQQRPGRKHAGKQSIAEVHNENECFVWHEDKAESEIAALWHLLISDIEKSSQNQIVRDEGEDYEEAAEPNLPLPLLDLGERILDRIRHVVRQHEIEGVESDFQDEGEELVGAEKHACEVVPLSGIGAHREIEHRSSKQFDWKETKERANEVLSVGLDEVRALNQNDDAKNILWMRLQFFLPLYERGSIESKYRRSNLQRIFQLPHLAEAIGVAEGPGKAVLQALHANLLLARASNVFSTACVDERLLLLEKEALPLVAGAAVIGAHD